MNECNIKITNQGSPVINSGYIEHQSERAAVISIDLRSKHCYVFGTGSNFDDAPLIDISASDSSLHLMDGVAVDALTEITFPDYKGWKVWCASLSRYTLNVCLVSSPHPSLPQTETDNP